MTLFTIGEVAKLLHVSTGTVMELARREGLPVIRVSPRRYLVSEEGLAEWLDARVVGNGDPARSTRSEEARTGESRSPFPRLSEDDARSGSTGRRRPPAASSRRSNVVSLGASRSTRAG